MCDLWPVDPLGVQRDRWGSRRASESVLQCIAGGVYLPPVCSVWSECEPMCCSVLRVVAVCCSVLPCVAGCCRVLQGVAVCCSVLQCVAAGMRFVRMCSLCANRVLHRWRRASDSERKRERERKRDCSVLQCDALCCSLHICVVHCVAPFCSLRIRVLQCVAV